ncbi:PAS domain S-box protein [Candidatus Magnetomonas plexicatena]|uniref:PAS domain S-box protein n=1 Tax=Candidatus Magnetomonas plexicatena TaxID=2552947 RepID=UPI00110481C8|nr:PAS domain S-box protein [Nitrospirales bacterium LBB_01]
MKISKKAVIVMLIMSVLPMCIISILLYHIASETIISHIYNDLDAIASVQKSRVETYISRNIEMMNLITSRPPMRVALERYIRTGEISQQEIVIGVISDAKVVLSDVSDIFILGIDGRVVASTNSSLHDKNLSKEEYFIKGHEGYSMDVFSINDKNEVLYYLSCPLFHEGRQLGVLVIETTGKAIETIAANYHGAGKTGETTIARRDKNGDALFMVPLRFNPDALLRKTIPKTETGVAITKALLKKELTFYDLMDYRGEHVISATRYIKETDWGLVVKIDRDEAFSSLYYVRNLFIVFTMLITIIVIIVSHFISRSLTTPIVRLTDVAKRIRNGGEYQTAFISSNDEVGFLSATFNEMTRSLLDTKNRLEHEMQDHIRLAQRNKTILQTSIDGFWIVNTEGKLIQANEAYCNMSGYTQQELSQMRVNDIELIETPAETKKRITRIMETGRDRFETRHRCKTGMIMDVEVSVNFIKSDNLMFSFIRDITHRKQIEEEIKRINLNLQKRVEEEVAKNRTMDQLMFEQSRYISMCELLMNISHHWRQPLCGIGVSVQDIKDAYLHGELNETYITRNVENAMNELQKLSDTIDNFRGFYTQDKEQTEFNISGEINKAEALLSGYIKEKGIVIDKELDETLMTKGYPNDFSNVLLNILTNAKDKFEKNNITGGIIKIKLNEDVTTGRVIISVSDNGGEIPADIKNKVFEPYFTTKDKAQGVGMGLYMAKVIIEKNMKGTISVRNIDGWCEFRIEI